jgi:hypothetical protein
LLIAFTGSILVEKSMLSDSLKLQGVVAQGLNSNVVVKESSIFNCHGTCILALQGGRIDIQDCKVFSSTTMQGVCAQGKGSSITLKNSQVYGMHFRCIQQSIDNLSN